MPESSHGDYITWSFDVSFWYILEIILCLIMVDNGSSVMVWLSLISWCMACRPCWLTWNKSGWHPSYQYDLSPSLETPLKHWTAIRKVAIFFFIDCHTRALYTTVLFQIKSEMHARTSEKVFPSVFEVSEDNRNGPKAQINLCPMLPLQCVTTPPPPVENYSFCHFL